VFVAGSVGAPASVVMGEGEGVVDCFAGANKEEGTVASLGASFGVCTGVDRDGLKGGVIL
jgi:hypothetical protein